MGLGTLRRYHTDEPAAAVEQQAPVAPVDDEAYAQLVDSALPEAEALGDVEALAGVEVEAEPVEVDAELVKVEEAPVEVATIEEVDVEEASRLEQPPLRGTGSGVDAWRAYATQQGLEVDGMTRDEIAAIF